MTKFLPFRLDDKADTIFCLVLLIASILIIANIRDYGASWDEPLLYDYASLLPDIYNKAARGIIFNEYQWFGDLKYYGTAYFILGEIGMRGLSVLSSLDSYDAWHIMNFLVFVMGTVALYGLCRQFTGKLPAMLAALLYFSQPLLLGHGIMNPKDAPFASFFLLSVALGRKMVDQAGTDSPTTSTFRARILACVNRWYGRLIVMFTGLILIDRIGGNFITYPAVSAVLDWAVSWPPASNYLAANFFSGGAGYVAARHASYVAKILANLNLVTALILVGLALTLIFLFLKYSTPFRRSIFWAGMAAGITASIRILGPAAAALILFIWLLQEKPVKMLIPALAYIATAAAAMFLSWPYLWVDPLSKFTKSYRFMSHIAWRDTVLFNGVYYPASGLPWYYLPNLIGIQLTLPVLLLAGIGSGLALFHLYTNFRDRRSFLLPLVWFYVPLFAWMVLQPNTFDNFRHFLFIIPPIFILAALGFSGFAGYVRHKRVLALLSLALLLPGFLSNVVLHPYPYVYYNGLVGWTPNIYDRYEGDYWGTSFCAAGRYLDAQAGSHTRIFVTDENLGWLLQRCTTRSPQLVYRQDVSPGKMPDYAVILARWGNERDIYPQMSLIHTIQIGNTPLVVIREAKR